MARSARQHNPGLLSERELVDLFCVRRPGLGLLSETTRESTDASNPHAIAIGPCGSGKTMLLLQAVAEVRRDAALSAAWFPVVFASTRSTTRNAPCTTSSRFVR